MFSPLVRSDDCGCPHTLHGLREATESPVRKVGGRLSTSIRQKMVSSFRGTEASKSKNPLGDYFVRQNNDFTRGWTSNIMPWGMLRG